jgi:hypothetical protein
MLYPTDRTLVDSTNRRLMNPAFHSLRTTPALAGDFVQWW